MRHQTSLCVVTNEPLCSDRESCIDLAEKLFVYVYNTLFMDYLSFLLRVVMSLLSGFRCMIVDHCIAMY